MSWKCLHCGYMNEDDNQYCLRCGAFIADARDFVNDVGDDDNDFDETLDFDAFDEDYDNEEDEYW